MNMLKTSLTCSLIVIGVLNLAGCDDDIEANTGASGITVGAGHESEEGSAATHGGSMTPTAAKDAHPTTMPSNTPTENTSAGRQEHPGTEKH